MFRLLRKLIVAVLALVGLVTVVGAAMFASGGIGARQAPGSVETTVLPRLRAAGIPAAARQAKNPVPASPDALAEGMEHFADHCAICHGNDGSGDTEMGRSMSPRVPDMRKPATQELSDGELFYIIENGVRLTGMPAWAHEDPNDNWKLVHFIRHQPKITPAELEKMKALNPKAPDDEPEATKPDGAAPAPKPAHTHTHKHGA